MHERPKQFPGWKICKYRNDIKELINETGSEYLLDYGCGKGWQYLLKHLHEYWGIPIPYCYDVGIEAFDVKPVVQFDGVVCVDVLEHIPEYQINETLSEIIGFAKKFVFLGIATYSGKKTLPNGEPCHVTVKSKEWWEKRIERTASRTAKNNLQIRIRYS